MAVFPDLYEAEKAASEASAIAETAGVDLQSGIFPEGESQEGGYLPENESARVNILYEMLKPGGKMLVAASARSFLSPLPEPDSLGGSIIGLRVGDVFPPDELLRRLVAFDYDDEYEVTAPGEFARKGGIVDVFSAGQRSPARIEYFGDEIQSMRLFSPENQRSTGKIASYDIVPRVSAQASEGGATLWDYAFKGGFLLAVVHPQKCRTHIERFCGPGELEAWDHVLCAGSEAASAALLLDAVESGGHPEAAAADCFPAFAHIFSMVASELEAGAGLLMRQLASNQIRQWLDSGYEVALIGAKEGACGCIADWCAQNGIRPEEVQTDLSPISSGLVLPGIRLAVVTEKELYFSGHGLKRPPFRPKGGRPSLKAASDEGSYADIGEGDYVVHSLYGIGIFRGIAEFSEDGTEDETFKIEFADDVVVYVPIWHADRLSRYVGARRQAPTLSRIGGKRWLASKIEAARAAKTLAGQMLTTQALRLHKPGFAFPPDDKMQHVFEESFPFQDTPDQARASAEIKADMRSPRPMDRLVCGDVGYGKTEVAARAAFKAVLAGRQVAVLVPTTVLAQQHYYTFTERFAEFPVVVEMLSRFRTPAEQRRIIERTAEGKVDILVGTHRIIQPDIRFADLGLVIIDEEQRFGVEAKERLKSIRASVDVLTMTATPIPRTLYMAMTGIRDMSTIMTAPEQRLPVQTVVCQHDEKIIASAITNELQRGGQAYFLHNRVASIDKALAKLQELVPDANFAAAHGQMNEHELEDVMSKFLSGGIDVLVCTTIIQSGIDIPNANTILIERADRFGLAELYQLRGRVGRWTRQAFAYFLLPKHMVLMGSARERIAAIRRYTQLGAGFRLAMRDMEIRGVGNLLGPEQSGHINQVGFDMYCSMLKAAVGELKGGDSRRIPAQVDISLDFLAFAYKAPRHRLAAALPPGYIPSERLRVDAYRRLARASEHSEIQALGEEFTDRFGPLPECSRNFLLFHSLRIALASLRIVSLKAVGSEAECSYHPAEKKRDMMFKLVGKTPEQKFHEILKHFHALIAFPL